MSKNKIFTYIVFLLLIVLVGVVFLSSNKDGGNKIETNSSNSSSNGSFSFKNAVGKQAPDFNLENIDGKMIKLSDYRGKNVILFFSGGSMCYPACWDQIEELANDKRFNNNNTEAFSIVVNPKSEWEKIIKETGKFSNAKILFDTTKSVSLAYDVLFIESSMHPGKYPGHTYFVIDKKGIVRDTYDDPSMAIRNDLIFSELSKIKGEE